ncbi:TetR/AcrR family transcriptional regulator [Gelidibacter maritimus]|uniref:TetR/AcrR family transcriptional regulator n=1 Tax=Gelidibacter maritimus TaxID=2761487 RepID=A0A7W2M499_9FLAO|nr:TetR/AcrR family transcriptional regulator [Gelidibacter maritimus]MBA6152211.1 TetR/AcrR family transcriptional regulator [Gelidibacter maritimus]
MREKIIDKATELFLTLGFKSVTMDDIANELGISKKTIYVHFENKTKLVESTTLEMFELISHGIDCICQLQKDPIEEIYDIKQLVMEHLKNETSSPYHQLQKYYPKIFNSLRSKQYHLMEECVADNLKRGIALGVYRENLEIDFISKMYFTSIMALKNKQLFPLKNLSMTSLMNLYLEYHVRGICTPKGLEALQKIINTQV